MAKKLRNVIHLYRGCDFIYVDGRNGGHNSIHLLNYENLIEIRRLKQYDEIKLLLRDLTSLTPEEDNVWQQVETKFTGKSISAIQEIHNQKRLRYYRSLNIDCDELIDSNQAINTETLWE